MKHWESNPTTEFKWTNNRTSYWFWFLRFDNRSAFDMKWAYTKISNKISRSLGIMCKLKWFLPQNILKILYNSLILPHLQYCILSWSFKSDRIFKLQKRAARIITCSKYNAHTEPLLQMLNLLKIEDIMKTKALKLYYRYKQNERPNILNQCSLNQMIITHMILDRSLFYINYQQRQAQDGYV